ncbi:hypothetical protein K402DRAFT_398910, partial [Aulographum hederae CBS 113979]
MSSNNFSGAGASESSSVISGSYRTSTRSISASSTIVLPFNFWTVIRIEHPNPPSSSRI